MHAYTFHVRGNFHAMQPYVYLTGGILHQRGFLTSFQKAFRLQGAQTHRVFPQVSLQRDIWAKIGKHLLHVHGRVVRRNYATNRFFPVEMLLLPRLRVLSMVDCNQLVLSQYLGDMQALEELRIRGAALTLHPRSFPPDCCAAKSLTSLELRACRLASFPHQVRQVAPVHVRQCWGLTVASVHHSWDSATDSVPVRQAWDFLLDSLCISVSFGTMILTLCMCVSVSGR